MTLTAAHRHYVQWTAPLPETAPDRQDVFYAVWRIKVGLPDGTTAYVASAPLASTGQPYQGRLEAAPTITRAQRNEYFGVTDISDIDFTVSTQGSAFPLDAPETMRGLPVQAERYDAYSGYAVVEWTGVVRKAEVTPGRLRITGTNLDTSILRNKVPSVVVTLATFPLAPSDDIGRTIPVPLGDVPLMPLPQVREDIFNNQYDYAVGHGVLSIDVSGVFRDGPNGTMYPVAFTECLNASNNPATSWADACRTDLYSGYTVIRFPVPQLDFNNGRHRLYANVTPLAGYCGGVVCPAGLERSPARAVRVLLTHTVWGLGKGVDTTSFDAAEAALAPLDFLRVDGALLEAVEAQEALEQLLEFRGMRLGSLPNFGAGTSTWTLSVDTPQRAIRLVAGTGLDGAPNNLSASGPRTSSDIEQATSAVVLRYRRNLAPATGDVAPYYFTRTIAVQPTGGELALDNDFIRDHACAVAVAQYVGQRRYVGQTQSSVTLPQEARRLVEGELIRVTDPLLGFDGDLFEALTIDKTLTTISAKVARWTRTAFNYTPLPPPADPILGSFDDLSRVSPDPATSIAITAEGVRRDAAGHDDGWARLAWTRPTTNCSVVIPMHRAHAASGPANPWILSGSVPVGTIQAVEIAGLATTVAYDFGLRTVNQASTLSTEPSLEGVDLITNHPALVDVVAPAVAVGLSALAGTGNSIGLKWTLAPESDYFDTEIFRNTVDVFTDLVATHLDYVSGTTYADIRVVQGTTYFYKIRHRDKNLNTALDANNPGISLSGSVTAKAIGEAQGTVPGTPSAPTHSSEGVYVDGVGGVFAFEVVNVPALPANTGSLQFLAKPHTATEWTTEGARITAGGGTARAERLPTGVSMDYAFQGFNAFAQASAISSVLTRTTLTNPTAPGDAGTPTLAKKVLKSATVEWSPSSDKTASYNWDLRTASAGGGTLVDSGNTRSTTLPIVSDAYATRFFRVQPVSAAGVTGNWTSALSITFVEADTVDIGGGAVSGGAQLNDGVSSYTVGTTETVVGIVGGPLTVSAPAGSEVDIVYYFDAGLSGGTSGTLRIRKGTTVGGTLVDTRTFNGAVFMGAFPYQDTSPTTSQSYVITLQGTGGNVFISNVRAISVVRKR